MRCGVHCAEISYCEVFTEDEILRHFIAEIEMEFRAPDLNKQPSGHSIMIIAKLVLIFQ